jgi:hypothetical protein
MARIPSDLIIRMARALSGNFDRDQSEAYADI